MLSETKKKNYFNEIDILRAFSVILIFLYHIDRSFEERKIFTKEYSNNLKISRFDLLDLLCDKDNCDLNAKNSNKLLYFRDNIHLTYKGSENLTSIFDVWFSNLFIR
jgi:hypothetical protein